MPPSTIELPGTFDDPTYSADIVSAADFSRISKLAYEKFGLNLKDGKQALVSARVGKLLRDQGLRSFEEYWNRIQSDRTGEALVSLINALTTNFTSFLREPEHFEFLKSVIVPQFAHTQPFRVWSAACATGEEPYSIMFTLAALNATLDTRLLATDISTRALEHASRGVYGEEQVQALPADWRPRFMLRGEGRSAGYFKAKPELRQRMEFRRFNLIEDSVPPQKFPVVFCRNVMIYFDIPTKSNVVGRLSEAILPGGYLFIGHSESLSGVQHSLEYVKPAIYRKVKGAA
ncbi:MAG: protein-glutamate O-methyltransferase CheR [Acidobacteria bacterium]|nr:protein-glutamate O-methyltransferase CheR [Acidobacteriota bacterium]